MNRRSIASRWLSSLATITINAVMQAVGLLIFARTLGPAEYAVIVAATAVAAIAAEFVGFGAGDLLVREVSRNPSAHRSAFGRALRLVAISIVPVALAAALIAQLWFRSAASFVLMLTLVGSEIVAVRIVFMTEQIAIAHHETHAANANRIYSTAVRFGVICFAVLAAGVSTAAQWAIFAVTGALLSAAGCLLLTIRRFGSPDLHAPFSSDFHIGLMFSLMQVVRSIQYAMDKFAVGWIAPGSTVGAFGVASRISQLGVLPTVAVTRITYPVFFAEGAKGLGASIAFAKRILGAVIAIGVVSTIGLGVVAYLLPYLFGPAFGAAKPFLLIMVLLPLTAGIQNLAGDALSGADFQAQRLTAGVIGIALAVVATAVGAVTYGLTGAIAGFMTGQVLSAVAIWLMVALLRNRRPSDASNAAS